MTPLRQRFIDDLRLRNYATRTIETYVWHVAAFAKHFGRSPDQLGAHAVRAYQLHLLAQQRSWSRFNQAVCALRFLFGTTLARPEQLPSIPYGKRPHKLPSVLSADEVLRLINAAKAGRDRLLLQVAYGCGLRLSEVAHPRRHRNQTSARSRGGRSRQKMLGQRVKFAVECSAVGSRAIASP